MPVGRTEEYLRKVEELTCIYTLLDPASLLLCAQGVVRSTCLGKVVAQIDGFGN